MNNGRNCRKQHCLRGREQTYSSRWNADLAGRITRALCATYEDQRGINHIDEATMPQRDIVLENLRQLLEVLFPGYTGSHPVTRAGLEFTIGNVINQVFQSLSEQVERAYAYRCKLECCETCNCASQAEQAVLRLLDRLPAIREVLKTDVQAALDGDPAAQSADDVIIAYPGLLAIAVHRVAHELYGAGVPLVPRVMSEYAHTTTGIDINPGATIGSSFFIDHGTGVVIGETAVIGDQVKLYQGVTLGAMSFPKDEAGRLVKGQKRHPNLEDRVTVYAGATILGSVTIGHDSVIGGNVWLTESVPPFTKITIAPPELAIKQCGATE